ncbi:TPA: glycosyltransferase family 2 protein [bacterium]|nr:glycosyltransferase family 2 protein [bacterium]
MKLSCIIITYNEEENIKDCLESVKWANEIIIVDSKSKDNTKEICREYTDRVIEKEWMGYGKQKEYARSLATHSWVLNIDADERISADLKNEILSSTLDKDAYSIPRKFFFLGKHLKFGGCSDKPVRLFRKEMAKFSDDLIHERLVIDGKIGVLKNPIFHYSYKNISDYFEKFNIYSDLEVSKKDRLNIPFVFQIFISLLDFINRYIFKFGFLDGTQGFLWASFSSFHRLVKYAKTWERSKFKS